MDTLGWISDVLTATASLVVVVGGLAGARYLRRANLQLTDCVLTRGKNGWLILRASAQLDNRGFLRLTFNKFKDDTRPSISVAETVDVATADGSGRQLREVRSWVAHNLDSDVISPGENASWPEVFHLDPPTTATVGYRITCRVPVQPSLAARVAWSMHWLVSWLGLAQRTNLVEWWEDQTFLPLPDHDARGVR